jgi:hypothetical protein
MQLKFQREYEITPKSWLLQTEYQSFQVERQQEHNHHSYYILKPVSGSCGRGIKLIDAKQNVSVANREGMLASRYIMLPHLINHLKYDLRVYVLVTSYCPLKVYIYKDGLVRFATEKYSLDPKLISSQYVHLTNFSINKKNSKFVKNDEAEHEDSSKWDFK